MAIRMELIDSRVRPIRFTVSLAIPIVCKRIMLNCYVFEYLYHSQRCVEDRIELTEVYAVVL